jgi:TatA/E family protein of Tat protein translocase
MPNIGTGEIIILLLLTLLLFGAKRLPEIGRSLGTGMKEFKDFAKHPSAATRSRPGRDVRRHRAAPSAPRT